jgi:hypothetical protein
MRLTGGEHAVHHRPSPRPLPALLRHGAVTATLQADGDRWDILRGSHAAEVRHLPLVGIDDQHVSNPVGAVMEVRISSITI